MTFEWSNFGEFAFDAKSKLNLVFLDGTFDKEALVQTSDGKLDSKSETLHSKLLLTPSVGNTQATMLCTDVIFGTAVVYPFSRSITSHRC